MTRLARRLRSQRGQALVFVVAIMTILIGMGALVIDGGSWWRAHRHLQTAADAGALAGVQDILSNPAGAKSTAISYAQQNYSGLPAPTVAVYPDALPTQCNGGPTWQSGQICVVAQTTAPGFLSKIYGAVFNNVTVRAHARAAVTIPSLMKNVAPVAVKNTSACAATNPGCYGQTVHLQFDESNVSSSTIGLINLTCHSSVSTACGSSAGIGGNQLKDWIENGYPDALPSNQWYGVKTGETVGPIKQGFNDRLNVPLFFPVFDTVANSGPNYFFHVIGWASFVITSVDAWGPQGRQLTGHFVTYTTSDLPAGLPPDGTNDFGVHVISLVQ
jgi:Flp pilus assembly protein TadG